MCVFSELVAVLKGIKYDLPFGLVVRISGFHPEGPGSIPGVGIPFWIFLFLFQFGFNPMLGNFIFLSLTTATFLFFSTDGIIQVLISPTNSETIESFTQQLRPRIDFTGLGRVSIVQVCRMKPITRAQFVAATKFWPTNFHENKRFDYKL